MSRGPRVEVARRGRVGPDGQRWAKRAARWTRRAARALGLTAHHEISVLLCDDPTIRRLNRQWRRRDRPTDVLSFPQHDLPVGASPPPGPVGDVAISLTTARRQARQFGEPLTGVVHRLLLHGLLHLLGYDHRTPLDAARMQTMERRLARRPPDA